MSFTIGSWGFPALVTIVVFGWLIIAGIRKPSPGGYAAIGDGIVSAFFAAAAAIVSLLAWLVWALLR